MDWKAGRLTRKRSKTKNHKTVPEVSYKLWPETLRLLREHRRTEGELVLTNRKGAPLKSTEIIDGREKTSDNIRSAYFRLVKKLGIRKDKQKPLKLLRKTSATMLGEHAEYGKFVQHFLGHAPSTVAEKHYERPSEKQFDKAVGWLRGQVLGD